MTQRSTPRRHGTFLSRGLALCLVLAAGLLSVGQSLAAAERQRPNIVVIMADDMGFSDIGCYGSEIRTPNLDRLADGGLRFTQFYNTARCCPTRACLLTGLYPHQAGMGHMTYDAGLPGYPGDLSRNAVTIAEVLKPAGYRTYMAGKWHVTRHVAPKGPKDSWPLQRGFEKFYGTITGAGSFYDPTTLCRGNTYITPVNDPEYKPSTYYYTDAISDNAVKFIGEHYRETADKPFFMYVAYTAAHWPMHALPADIAKYKGRYDKGYGSIRAERFARLKKLGMVDPSWQLSPQAGNWEKFEHKAWEARLMEVYAAMIDNMDQGIGRIVEALKKQGQLDNTLIMFLQDNGGCAEGMGRGDNPKWHLSDLKAMGPDQLQPNIWPPMQTRDGRPVLGGPGVMAGPADSYLGYGRAWANVSNTPFREYKHWVHEGGISSPLVAHWPEGFQRRGELEHQPAHLIDLMATCVDAAGAEYPTRYADHDIRPREGVSLAAAFQGRDLNRPTPIFWEHEGNRAVRQGKWKLVAKGAVGRWELYDMAADRTEMHNLAKTHPDRVESMAQAWENWARRAKAKPWPWDPKPKKS